MSHLIQTEALQRRKQEERDRQLRREHEDRLRAEARKASEGASHKNDWFANRAKERENERQRALAEEQAERERLEEEKAYEGQPEWKVKMMKAKKESLKKRKKEEEEQVNSRLQLTDSTIESEPEIGVVTKTYSTFTSLRGAGREERPITLYSESSETLKRPSSDTSCQQRFHPVTGVPLQTATSLPTASISHSESRREVVRPSGREKAYREASLSQDTPAWKQQMMTKKQEMAERQEKIERAERAAEEARLAKIPAWKRAMLEEKVKRAEMAGGGGNLTAEQVRSKLTPAPTPNFSQESSIRRTGTHPLYGNANNLSTPPFDDHLNPAASNEKNDYKAPPPPTEPSIACSSPSVGAVYETQSRSKVGTHGRDTYSRFQSNYVGDLSEKRVASCETTGGDGQPRRDVVRGGHQVEEDYDSELVAKIERSRAESINNIEMASEMMKQGALAEVHDVRSQLRQTETIDKSNIFVNGYQDLSGVTRNAGGGSVSGGGGAPLGSLAGGGSILDEIRSRGGSSGLRSVETRDMSSAKVSADEIRRGITATAASNASTFASSNHLPARAEMPSTGGIMAEIATGAQLRPVSYISDKSGPVLPTAEEIEAEKQGEGIPSQDYQAIEGLARIDLQYRATRTSVNPSRVDSMAMSPESLSMFNPKEGSLTENAQRRQETLEIQSDITTRRVEETQTSASPPVCASRRAELKKLWANR